MENMRKRCEKCGKLCLLYDSVWDERQKAVKRLFICQCGQKFSTVHKDQARTDRASEALKTLEGVNRKLEELGLGEQ